MERLGNPGRISSGAYGTWQRGRTIAAFHSQTISTTSTDEGGAAVGAPAMPANATELRKAQAARRRRQKDSYGLLTKHLLHKEHLQHITQNFFQERRTRSVRFAAVRPAQPLATARSSCTEPHLYGRNYLYL